MQKSETGLPELAVLAGFDEQLDEYALTELGCYVVGDEKLFPDTNRLARYEYSLRVPGKPATGDEIMAATLAAYSHAEKCALRNRIFAKRHWELAQERADEFARRARIKARILRRP